MKFYHFTNLKPNRKNFKVIFWYLNQLFWYFSASQTEISRKLLPKLSAAPELPRHMTDYSLFARNVSVLTKHMTGVLTQLQTNELILAKRI